MMNAKLSQDLTERGWVPDTLVRRGIQTLLKQRLKDIDATDSEQSVKAQMKLIKCMNNSAIAEVPELANEQHYELPAEFFKTVLGSHNKYSCALWEEGVVDIETAEVNALEQTCKRADIKNNQRILELGCGWGSLTFWMASHYPNSEITAVSNSKSQRAFLVNEIEKRGISNVSVITADMNDFDAHSPGQFDRVVSLEMFEHMRNWRVLFNRISAWLKPDGVFFMHIFVHRSVPYFFEQVDDSDWMSRYFFSGGMMPSADLPLFFQEDMKLDHRWFWNGKTLRKNSQCLA